MKIFNRFIIPVVVLLFSVSPVAAGAKLGGAFVLLDHNGETVTEKTYLGKYLLISFGYTYCPDVCPTGLQTVSDAIDIMAEKGKSVQPLFVSIDPERDTVEIMKDYVSNFHPRLIGLTGSVESVKAMSKLYKVRYRKNLEEGAAADEYLVDHTANFYLMGPQGEFINSFSHRTRPEHMAEWVGEAIK
ncbi:MAG: SCO family protein [Rhodospirillales bacterium]|nr:SCO family protein [Rhodospirillales bacterium]